MHFIRSVAWIIIAGERDDSFNDFLSFAAQMIEANTSLSKHELQEDMSIFFFSGEAFHWQS